MRYVRKLTEVEEITIVEMIELSNKGNRIDKIVGRNRDTISTWINEYEQ